MLTKLCYTPAQVYGSGCSANSVLLLIIPEGLGEMEEVLEILADTSADVANADFIEISDQFHRQSLWCPQSRLGLPPP